ncbi:MAG: hypothetical protein KDE47_26400, partial [Caldilineaceae bacterium]|nr:hypothetical protein [Caldilineaceae bacterium]
DSRALARALTGDIEGAIEDYEFYLAETSRNNTCDAYCVVRKAWKEQLEAGEDPVDIFDAHTLESLKTE